MRTALSLSLQIPMQVAFHQTIASLRWSIVLCMRHISGIETVEWMNVALQEVE